MKEQGRQEGNVYYLGDSQDPLQNPIQTSLAGCEETSFSDMPLHNEKIYQIKITLEDLQPPIWRRVLVPSGISFYDLHYIIQIAFGWQNAHLFAFQLDGKYISMIEEWDDNPPDFDAAETVIDGFLELKKKCRYEYDFGDGWMHKVVLEETREPRAGETYPLCVKGKGRCPPEDVGGPFGYADFLQTITDPEHPEREEMLKWATGDAQGVFDPSYFNLDEINEIFRMYAAEMKNTENVEGIDPSEEDGAAQTPPPTLEVWSALYQVAEEIKQLKPWKTLRDRNLFAVMLPGRSEPDYLSIMGHNETCYAIAVYSGYKSLAGLLALRDAPDDEPFPIQLRYQNCLLCHFGNREEVSTKDRAVYNQLGIKFRGKNQWTYFRMLKPGTVPWYINGEEGALLAQVLQNFVILYQAYSAGEVRVDFERDQILLRQYDEKLDLWKNAAHDLNDLPMERPRVKFIDQICLAKLKKEKKTKADLSIDILYVPSPMQDSADTQPFFPALLLLVDNKSELILSQEVLAPHDDTTSTVLSFLAGYVMQRGCPARLFIRDEGMACYVEDFCVKLGISVIRDRRLPVIDEIASSLEDFPL